VEGSRIDGTIVVLGSGREDILKRIEKLPVRHCHNIDFRNGMLSSVKCGLLSVPADAGAIIIFLGDQPKIESVITDKIIDAYLRSGKGIIIPVYNGRCGHPLLVDNRYREEIFMLKPEEGLKALRTRFPGDVLEVEVNTPSVVNDIDTPEEYLNEI
jgi:molybdenum cofactor cytidylyltransferase